MGSGPTMEATSSARSSLQNPLERESWIRRKISTPLGFSRLYNLPLFVIFAGALLGFSLARISYLNVGGMAPSSFAQSAAPGEWYSYHTGHYRIGISLHLGAVIPMGLLVVWQFLPVIRHKFLLFHRINGYICILLSLVANVGALMIARRAFGGGLDTQTAVGVLALGTTISVSMAYYNIKRLQIDQHRAWMLRAFVYMGSIITMRILMILCTLIISINKEYHMVKTCDEITFLYDGSVSVAASFYPICADGQNHEIIVQADFNTQQPETIGAALDLSFGPMLWLAIFMHAVGVEIYLALTPSESNRLRQVSYERQLEAGHKHPGSSGLTVDRWGDAEPWVPRHNGEILTVAK